MPENSPDFPIDADLAPVQIVALGALLAGETQTSAAEQAGVTRRTLWNWLDAGPFASALEAGKLRLRQQVVRRLDALGTEAAERLGELMRSTDERIALRATEQVLNRLVDPSVLATLSAEQQRINAEQAQEVGQVMRDVLEDFGVDLNDPENVRVIREHMIRIKPEGHELDAVE